MTLPTFEPINHGATAALQPSDIEPRRDQEESATAATTVLPTDVAFALAPSVATDPRAVTITNAGSRRTADRVQRAVAPPGIRTR